jgi:hypothetical protein
VLLGVFEFSRRKDQPDCRPIIPLGPPDRNRAAAALAALDPEGGTPIGHAMITAKRALDETGLSRRHLLIVSDGENTDGFKPEEVASAIARRPVAVGRAERNDRAAIRLVLATAELEHAEKHRLGRMRVGITGELLDKVGRRPPRDLDLPRAMSVFADDALLHAARDVDRDGRGNAFARRHRARRLQGLVDLALRLRSISDAPDRLGWRTVAASAHDEQYEQQREDRVGVPGSPRGLMTSQLLTSKTSKPQARPRRSALGVRRYVNASRKPQA